MPNLLKVKIQDGSSRHIALLKLSISGLDEESTKFEGHMHHGQMEMMEDTLIILLLLLITMS